MTERRIPGIDIGPFRDGSPAAKAAVADAVGAACEAIGFLLISGHGVPPALIDRAIAVARAFFDLPETEKRRYLAATAQAPRGYMPSESKSLAATYGQDTPPDLREQFMIGPVEPHGEAFAAHDGAREMYRPNIWPARPEAYRETFSELFRAFDALAADLMRIFAVALALPEDYFADKTDKSCSTLGALHYPARGPDLPAGQLRAGAHTDFGSLTILYPDPSPGGLQVLGPDGGWIDVRAGPGELVVNLGDMMSRWTNDRWRSTLHRVVNPPLELAGSRRQSIAFFQHPNYDVEIARLETCRGPGEAPKYPPVLAGEHVYDKMVKRAV